MVHGTLIKGGWKPMLYGLESLIEKSQWCFIVVIVTHIVIKGLYRCRIDVIIRSIPMMPTAGEANIRPTNHYNLRNKPLPKTKPVVKKKRAGEKENIPEKPAPTGPVTRSRRLVTSRIAIRIIKVDYYKMQFPDWL